MKRRQRTLSTPKASVVMVYKLNTRQDISKNYMFLQRIDVFCFLKYLEIVMEALLKGQSADFIFIISRLFYYAI